MYIYCILFLYTMGMVKCRKGWNAWERSTEHGPPVILIPLYACLLFRRQRCKIPYYLYTIIFYLYTVHNYVRIF